MLTRYLPCVIVGEFSKVDGREKVLQITTSFFSDPEPIPDLDPFKHGTIQTSNYPNTLIFQILYCDIVTCWRR